MSTLVDSIMYSQLELNQKMRNSTRAVSSKREIVRRATHLLFRTSELNLFQMDAILAVLCAPPYPAVAGAVFATGRYLKIHESIMRRLKRIKSRDIMSPKSIRHKYKKEIIVSAMKAGRSFNQTGNLVQKIGSLCKTKEQARDLEEKLRCKRKDEVCETCENWSDEIGEVTEICSLNEDVKFPFALPYWKQESAIKIAEGTYGEIYSFRHADGSPRIFKCMPVNDKHPLRESPNLPIQMSIPDIVCSTFLSKLHEGPFYVAPNFPKVYRVCVVKDRFPDALMQTWWKFKENNSSDHPQPDMYREDQRFVTIETSFCGDRFIKEAVNNTWLGATIMTQLVSALAVAEEAYNFEHRDLHLGNILIQETKAAELYYTVRDLNFSVKTAGHHVFIIDFTLSRIFTGSRVYCVSLEQLSKSSSSASENQWLNHKYIYGLMAEIFQDNWNTFNPKTNIFWLKYMNETIIDFLQKNNPELCRLVPQSVECNEMTAMVMLCKWNDCILQFDSAKAFLEGAILQDNPLVFAVPKS